MVGALPADVCNYSKRDMAKLPVGGVFNLSIEDTI